MRVNMTVHTPLVDGYFHDMVVTFPNSKNGLDSYDLELDSSHSTQNRDYGTYTSKYLRIYGRGTDFYLTHFSVWKNQQIYIEGYTPPTTTTSKTILYDSSNNQLKSFDSNITNVNNYINGI